MGAVWLNLVELNDLANCRLEKPFDNDFDGVSARRAERSGHAPNTSNPNRSVQGLRSSLPS